MDYNSIIYEDDKFNIKLLKANLRKAIITNSDLELLEPEFGQDLTKFEKYQFHHYYCSPILWSTPDLIKKYLDSKKDEKTLGEILGYEFPMSESELNQEPINNRYAIAYMVRKNNIYF